MFVLLTYLMLSLTKAPGDVRKSFREDGGTVEQHLVKECPPAVLDEVFSPSVTVAEADGSGMVRKRLVLSATSAFHTLVYTHCVDHHEE